MRCRTREWCGNGVDSVCTRRRCGRHCPRGMEVGTVREGTFGSGDCACGRALQRMRTSAFTFVDLRASMMALLIRVSSVVAVVDNPTNTPHSRARDDSCKEGGVCAVEPTEPPLASLASHHNHQRLKPGEWCGNAAVVTPGPHQRRVLQHVHRRRQGAGQPAGARGAACEPRGARDTATSAERRTMY
jgi:hypothetical protein